MSGDGYIQYIGNDKAIYKIDNNQVNLIININNKDKILYKDPSMTKEIWDSLTNDEKSEIIRCL